MITLCITPGGVWSLAKFEPRTPRTHGAGPSLSMQVLREPWWVLPAEVLHGLTFAAMWAATTDYAHDIAPGAFGRLIDEQCRANVPRVKRHGSGTTLLFPALAAHRGSGRKLRQWSGLVFISIFGGTVM